MNKLLIAIAILISQISFAQIESSNKNIENNLTIIMDAGLLIGHSESYYPAPFNSNISFLKNFNNRLWIGAGSGAEIIGKTFIPLFVDLRFTPFNQKPFFIYNKIGGTFCINKKYNDGYSDGNNTYYHVDYPHPLNENIETTGGFMNECGIGIILKRTEWKTSISLGYNYQTTKDKVTSTPIKTYENNFNRVAIRVGFWF